MLIAVYVKEMASTGVGRNGSMLQLRQSVPVANGLLEHHIVWHCALLASSEHASLLEQEDDHRLRGIVVLPRGGAPCHIDYEVIADRDWLPRVCVVAVTLPGEVRRIELTSDPVGRSDLDGRAARFLDGCGDIDLGWTPATNTIPIRRLGLEIGETASTLAAWVRFPELDVVANAQHYTRLAPDRWRYRSGDYDFELVTDVTTGLVLAYGDDLWQPAATELQAHE